MRVYALIKQIPTGQLKKGMVAADDIFAPGENIPIARKNTRLTEGVLARLHQHGVPHVTIDVSEGFLPEEQKEEKLPLPEVKPLLDEKLRTEAVSGIRRMFTAVGEGTSEETMTTAYHAVKELDGIVDQLVDTLSTETGALVHIADLKSHDEYTYHHSLSVAVLSIAIGQSMSLPKEEVCLLGRCAIVHDIGKILIPTEIINKTSKLSDDEFKTMKQHSRKGYEYLLKANIGDEAFRRGVLGHHEKMDGKGYPGGLKGDDVPFFSRIIAVADVYDAVTSYRSYRKPMAPSEAIELVLSEAGSAFDYDLVKYFIDRLEMYPLNTTVELSNKRLGVVEDNKNSMRPVIRMTDNSELIDLMDLNSQNLVITRVLNNERPD